MDARIAPAWDVRHRIVVGVGCGVVALAAILAGMMQQLWERFAERDAETYEFLFSGSWFEAIGLGSIATVFVVFMLLTVGSFLLPSRRTAAIVVLLLNVATAGPLFLLAWRLFVGMFLSGTKSVM